MMKKILLAAALVAMPYAAFAQDKPLVQESGQIKQLPSGKYLLLNPSTTGAAPLNIGSGTGPSSPNDGDIWITSAGIFARINGVTVGPLSGATTFANPSGTAGPSAVNGAASTAMRSDAAPAVQKGSNSQFGIVEGDGTTLNCVAGVCSGAAGANPTATAGPSAVNGSASTYMRSDAAPAVQKATNAQFGIVEGDGSTLNCVAGVCSGAAGANPTATAGPNAINGSAATFMRSDAAPAIQKATNGQFGLAEGDGVTLTCVAGVCSAVVGGSTPTYIRAASITVLMNNYGGL